MTKHRFLREGDELTDDTMIVIRGGLLDAMRLRSDALRNFDVYGTFGISVFAIKVRRSTLLRPNLGSAVSKS